MITIFLVIGIVAALIFAFYIARRSVLSGQTHDELSRQLEPVDIAAFRNLVDPNESRYLREKLAPAAFRAVQRRRAMAALAYVKAVAHNAALLMAMADPARSSPNAEIAVAAQAIVEQALQLRIRSLLLMPKLWLGIALPGLTVSGSSIVDRYQDVSSGFGNFIRLSRPAGETDQFQNS
jgi:hypothetical protein